MNHQGPASDVNISQQSSEVVREGRNYIAVTISLYVSKTSNVSVTSSWSSMIFLETYNLKETSSYIIATYIVGIIMPTSCFAVVSKVSMLMDMEAMFTRGQTRQIQYECCIT